MIQTRIAPPLSWLIAWRRQDAGAVSRDASREAARRQRVEAALARRSLELERARWRTWLKPEPNI